MSGIFADRTTINSENRLAEMFGGNLGKDGIKFSAGNPDPELFPVTQIKKAFNNAINEYGNQIFEYQTISGFKKLRNYLAQRTIHTEDIKATANNILITQGGQQALDLISKLFLNNGDGIVVEAPTYVGALSAFEQYNPCYYDVTLKEDGLDLEQLELLLQAHPDIKLLYTIPDFQNPTGVTLSLNKRKKLVKLAEEYDFFILEDTPYRDLRYKGSRLPSIKSFDHHGHVIFVSSFSKILMPGLRIGWITADKSIIDQLSKLKASSDLETSGILLTALNQYIEDNNLDTHIVEMLPIYQKRLVTMLEVLDEKMPADVHYTRPEGGFFIWLTLPDVIDTQKLLNETCIPKDRISFVPGKVFYAHKNRRNSIRLNFSGVNEKQIKIGISKLAKSIESVITANKVETLL
ncbi:PLP-dependent aminotransferase family protein [Liquorilactobacillus mali]|uniref:aminotransferase-like domain-containing protein n=1 Tax=Liquorilactobacillus mali TaxID=1618 RepID=UPI0023508676|nr:PLP-dependent aminotransferase family protein [Liquorilactobacillus mali]MDC7952548.1 PLP-dependent aminotransferase family protein [Liquorilactobacillus mali]